MEYTPHQIFWLLQQPKNISFSGFVKAYYRRCITYVPTLVYITYVQKVTYRHVYRLGCTYLQKQITYLNKSFTRLLREACTYSAYVFIYSCFFVFFRTVIVPPKYNTKVLKNIA